MKLTPVLILGLDGQPITPASAADLVLLAREATAQAHLTALQSLARESTAQALLTAIQALPRPSIKIHRVTVSLAGALNNQAVGLGTLTRVHAVTVVDLAGAVVPTLKFNGIGEATIPLAKGEVRDGLDVSTLHVSCAAGGGSLVLELHGR